MNQPPTRRILPNWARVLLQSTLVAFFVLVTGLLVYRFHAKLAITSLAASAFIAFGFPTAESARARYLLGGYCCGTVFGVAFSLLYHRLLPAHLAQSTELLILFSTLAVFFTALAMYGLKFQHPPAAALALCLVLDAEPLGIAFSMLLCAALLCGARWAVLRLWGGHFPTAEDTTAPKDS